MPLAAAPEVGSTAASVGMPINSPCALTNAPPLLPGLIGAHRRSGGRANLDRTLLAALAEHEEVPFIETSSVQGQRE